MVSFWPWKGDASSPASFEKTLSTLSAKITDTQARLDRVRSSSRRVKVLWTLYLGFAYLVYAIVLLLVVGYKNLGAYDWTGMAGGPVSIYAIRTLIGSYFAYRIDTISARLKSQQDERAKTIQKLKDATKYDSTMQLIQKYGGEGKKKAADETSSPTPKKGARKSGPASTTTTTTTTGRTNLPPPPTANIVGREAAPQQPSAEFAPNAFNDASAPPPAPRIHQQQYMTPVSHWYDRIFDVLLGEDETAASNRFALICRDCRLVNGQAPPGTKSLAEVGLWRCSSCGSTNGEVDEGKRIMQEVLASKQDQAEADASGSEHAQGPAGSVKARQGGASRKGGGRENTRELENGND
ncbi:uncharacterized protein UV8b_05521 [Ustilaginoidea virens]|uniref:Endoplasmic reticulum junction formation protein lunapark n=1 Tax=Ustilaginoidea virens TaxID=1159556 RepID=A0A8E5HTY6_USTVR|nr:uncharacterized protein UV8b_05521 [Ustilaginoidea virens]QUC21278.1 hypothetical protein UV8b_05521 [Ustilaginoidea virens]